MLPCQKPKLLAAEHIPLLFELFSDHCEIHYFKGRQPSKDQLRDCDILLVRSITKVNADLLRDTSVRFVGSTTTGHEHIDTNYLDQAGIAWSAAPGCNAGAVVDYVLACLASLHQQGKLKKKKVSAAVIGVGKIGSRVVKLLQGLGGHVLMNDPPRAAADSQFLSRSLDALADCDLICVHTPLTRAGDHPTYHLLDKTFFQGLKPGCIILNAGRGAVIDERALLNSGHHVDVVLDVWENEPAINLALLKKALIATPHIAGHTLQAKWRGTWMVYQAAAKHFAWPARESLPELDKREALSISSEDWPDGVLAHYNPLPDDHTMRECLLAQGVDVDHAFDRLRADYSARATPEFKV